MVVYLVERGSSMKERRDAIFEKKDGKTRISVFEFKGIADKLIE